MRGPGFRRLPSAAAPPKTLNLRLRRWTRPRLDGDPTPDIHRAKRRRGATLEDQDTPLTTAAEGAPGGPPNRKRAGRPSPPRRHSSGPSVEAPTHTSPQTQRAPRARRDGRNAAQCTAPPPRTTRRREKSSGNPSLTSHPSPQHGPDLLSGEGPARGRAPAPSLQNDPGRRGP